MHIGYVYSFHMSFLRYLNADEQGDAPFSASKPWRSVAFLSSGWVVESFAEVELPEPWTSFKGVGSVVCYLNNETNETTWKHPFYDYFAREPRGFTRETRLRMAVSWRFPWCFSSFGGSERLNG